MFEVHYGAVRPKAGSDLFARNHFPGSLREQQKKSEGMSLYRDFHSTFVELTGQDIETIRAEVDFRHHSSAPFSQFPEQSIVRGRSIARLSRLRRQAK